MLSICGLTNMQTCRLTNMLASKHANMQTYRHRKTCLRLSDVSKAHQARFLALVLQNFLPLVILYQPGTNSLCSILSHDSHPPLQRLIEPECSQLPQLPVPGIPGIRGRMRKEDELTEQQLGMETRHLKIGNTGSIYLIDVATLKG